MQMACFLSLPYISISLTSVGFTHSLQSPSLSHFDVGARVVLDSGWEAAGAVRPVVSFGAESTEATPPVARLGPIPRSHNWKGTPGGAVAPSK